jgi:hypothetical protein
MVSACREAGKRVDYLVSPEGGHGFTDSVDEQAVYVAIEQFLARHLGGWSDPEAPPRVAARVKALQREGWSGEGGGF